MRILSSASDTLMIQHAKSEQPFITPDQEDFQGLTAMICPWFISMETQIVAGPQGNRFDLCGDHKKDECVYFTHICGLGFRVMKVDS